MMDMSHHQFCLKWNNHSSNLLKVFGRLFSNESFTDVTLAAEGRSIRAHKMVLSACSTYFEQLFLEHAEPNPIVIMRETSFIDLAIIVEFMYKGEINVSQDQLGSLLRTAESLRVKGLAQASSGGNGSSDANDSQNNHHSSSHQSSAVQHKTSTAASSPTTPPLAGTSNPPPFSPPPYPSGQQAPPPPALLPLFQNAALLSAAAAMDSLAAGYAGGRESPSTKRRRIKPKIEQDYPQLNHSVDSGSSRPSSASFTPRIENVVTMLKCGQAAAAAAAATQQQRNESVEAVAAAAAAAAATVAGVAGSALDLRLTDPAHVTWDLHELKARLEPRAAFPSLPGANNTNTTQPTTAIGPAAPAATATTAASASAATQQQPQTQLGDSETLRKVQQEKSEPHCFFRSFAVYKFNDYIAHGTRQQYWEEPFTKAVMEGIQDRELDLKKGAELLGVSYSTLYGRYRECHGYLRHAWTRDYRRSSGPGGGSAAGGEWWESDPQEIHRRGENGGMTAEELVVEVDSYVDDDDDIMAVERDDGDKSLSDAEAEAASKQESLILSIRHGKVQTGRKPDALNSKESSS